MRQIDGVVINEHQIKLRLGTILTVNHSFNIGARVKVSWDMTENKLGKIEYAKDVFPGMSVKQPKGELNDGVTWEEVTSHDYIDGIVR